MTKLAFALVCASLAVSTYGAAIQKRQTAQESAQLAAQKDQLDVMNVAKMVIDAAHQAGAIALISAQAASQTAHYDAMISAHQASDSQWLADQIATIRAQAESMGIAYDGPKAAPAAPTPGVQPPIVTASTTAAPTSGAQPPIVQVDSSTAVSILGAQPPMVETGSTAPADSISVLAQSLRRKAPTHGSPQFSPGDGSSMTGAAAPGVAHHGDYTHYDVGLGACGHTSSDLEAVVAISQIIFDAYTPAGDPNKNPLCGKSVSLKGVDGQSYTATIVDRCQGCAAGDLDLGPGLFNKCTSNGDGRVKGMEWTFV